MTSTMQDFKAELFRTLANPVRIRILEVLRAAESLTVGDIQERVGIEPSNVSQHLSILQGTRSGCHASGRHEHLVFDLGSGTV